MRGFFIGYIVTSLVIHMIMGNLISLVIALPSIFMVLYLVKSRSRKP